eukprot:GFYU01011289.1.p1 GENE.GFYU01011289.1~~GFYU01011289.1.p1  ORF type:complete len:632 (+),score=139.65 GFYU01011289.1:256-2151(+)
MKSTDTTKYWSIHGPGTMTTPRAMKEETWWSAYKGANQKQATKVLDDMLTHAYEAQQMHSAYKEYSLETVAASAETEAIDEVFRHFTEAVDTDEERKHMLMRNFVADEKVQKIESVTQKLRDKEEQRYSQLVQSIEAEKAKRPKTPKDVNARGANTVVIPLKLKPQDFSQLPPSHAFTPRKSQRQESLSHFKVRSRLSLSMQQGGAAARRGGSASSTSQFRKEGEADTMRLEQMEAASHTTGKEHASQIIIVDGNSVVLAGPGGSARKIIQQKPTASGGRMTFGKVKEQAQIHASAKENRENESTHATDRDGLGGADSGGDNTNANANAVGHSSGSAILQKLAMHNLDHSVELGGILSPRRRRLESGASSMDQLERKESKVGERIASSSITVHTRNLKTQHDPTLDPPQPPVKEKRMEFNQEDPESDSDEDDEVNAMMLGKYGDVEIWEDMSVFDPPKPRKHSTKIPATITLDELDPHAKEPKRPIWSERAHGTNYGRQWFLPPDHWCHREVEPLDLEPIDRRLQTLAKVIADNDKKIAELDITKCLRDEILVHNENANTEGEMERLPLCIMRNNDIVPEGTHRRATRNLKKMKKKWRALTSVMGKGAKLQTPMGPKHALWGMFPKQTSNV